MTEEQKMVQTIYKTSSPLTNYDSMFNKWFVTVPMRLYVGLVTKFPIIMSS